MSPGFHPWLPDLIPQPHPRLPPSFRLIYPSVCRAATWMSCRHCRSASLTLSPSSSRRGIFETGPSVCPTHLGYNPDLPDCPSVCPTHLGCNPGALTPSLFFILPLSNHQTLHPRLGQSLFLRAHRHIYQLPSDHIISYVSAYASVFPAG